MALLPTVLPPISQKHRPIGLALWDNGLKGLFIFSIRPEEIRYTTPTRTEAIQTIGGSWVDEFGLGLAKVRIQGHTGWHGGPLGIPGELFFQYLHDGIFLQYFKLRQQARDSGRDPDEVQCILADSLNVRVFKALPGEFELHRSRTRPLLMMFNMTLTALETPSALGAVSAAATAIQGLLP